ncbi:MAG TPA: hypothetical protein VL026_01665, partial [Rhizomicrobium sp.]|nr:hypothetical protein [Rhizomicrobium sp.]
MSELIDTRNTAGHARGQLLATASALALLASICATQGAHADEGADRPTVWIELGGNLERVDGGQEAFAPAFVLKHLNAPYNVISPLSAQKLPRYSFGGGAKFTFEPAGTDWLFTAALRYGRSNSNKHLHQQTMTVLVQKTAKYNDPVWGDKDARRTRKVRRFNDLEAKHSQSHAVLDFMAGKDVGLGRLGTSALFLGVRFAQFQSKSNIGFKSFPDPRYSTIAYLNDPGARHHSYFGQQSAERNFRGLGP